MFHSIQDFPIRNGTIVLDGLNDIVLDGHGDTLRQLLEKRATIEIKNCHRITVRNWRFIGKGSESPWHQNSGNGVAAVRILDSASVSIIDCDMSNFAGGCIRFRGEIPSLQIVRNRIRGMGRRVISPGNNGSDAAIGHGGGTAVTNDLLIADNDIAGHAFGIFVPTGRGMRIFNNSIHDIPGQHGIYGQPGGQISVTGNVLRDIAYCGIKFQIGSGADMGELLSIGNNNIDGCGQAAILVADATRKQWFTNVAITSNHVTRSVHVIYLRRVRDCFVQNNRWSQITNIPIYLDDVTGEIQAEPRK